MKVTRATPAFAPVTITLETQEEVDAIYAILVHRGLTENTVLVDKWTLLSPYKGPNSTCTFDQLEDRLIERYK